MLRFSILNIFTFKAFYFEIIMGSQEIAEIISFPRGYSFCNYSTMSKPGNGIGTVCLYSPVILSVV